MNLRHVLRSGAAAVCLASAAWPAAAVAPGTATAPRGALDVRVAQADGFSRVEFHWAGNAKMTSRRDGQVLTLSFSRDADPDISRLRTSPPKWIETAEKRRVGGHLEVAITLADDADARVGTADGAGFVNVFERPEPAPVEVAQAVEPEPARANPVPAGGVVRMESQVAGGQGLLSFAWANPAGAAVFRRGEDVWVVFDAAADLDVSKAPKGLKQFGEVRAFRGADYSAVRIRAPRGTPLFATSQGNSWTIAFGPGAQTQPTTVRLARDGSTGPAILQAAMAGATRVIRLPDPEAGDTINVVTALGPAKGLPTRRDYVQMAFLPSVQGLAVEAKVDDLNFAREGDLVRIGRNVGGLTLSPAWAARERADTALGAPAPAAMPGLVDYENWPKTGEGGFLRRYNSLLSAATVETQTREGPTGARMALARFLVGSELSFEAIGVLNDAARTKPELLENPEFRALRGVARVMARRYKEAEADFSSPVLAEDPATALWRAHVAVQTAQWPEARAQFAKGIEAFAQFPAAWKARFARDDAQAAMAMGDLAGADARIRLALMDKTDPLEELATRLVQARIIEAQGHKDRALRMYAAIGGAPLESIAAPAQLRATQIRLETGKINQDQAAQAFDGLRYRWRGDATELETIRALGQLYLGQGRYREALEALRSAGARLPDLPEALQLQADLTSSFRALFLDGLADGLEPVQALALFYDFKDLTPVGSDGDLMVRKMVRRLVDVDLLGDASKLLKYQIENRLDGVPRAQVATDLATIYLMDRKPEQAIQVINASRTTALPTALTNERRVLEARAWAGVGRYDSALEIIEKDNSAEAQELRAEVTWKKKDWAAAGPLFEKALGERWKNASPLSSEDEGRLLRAGVAYSLASDEAALARLDQRYQGFYEQAHNPEALRIALSGAPTGQVGVGDFSRVSADSEAFAGWVAKMKKRMRAGAGPISATKTAAAAPAPAPVPGPAKPAAPAKQAQAATPKAPAKG